MADKKIIAVVGSTGAQGGGLCQAILNDLIVRFFFALLGGSAACLHLLSHGSRLLAAASRRYASSVIAPAISTGQLTCHPGKKLMESTGS